MFTIDSGIVVQNYADYLELPNILLNFAAQIEEEPQNEENYPEDGGITEKTPFFLDISEKGCIFAASLHKYWSESRGRGVE